MGSAESIITLIEGCQKINLADMPNPKAAIQRIMESGRTMNDSEALLKKFIDMIAEERDLLGNAVLHDATIAATNNVMEASAYTDMIKDGSLFAAAATAADAAATTADAAATAASDDSDLQDNALYTKLSQHSAYASARKACEEASRRAALDKFESGADLDEDDQDALADDAFELALRNRFA